MSKYLLKPKEDAAFRQPQSTKGSEIIEKALPTQRFRNAFPERQKPYKPNGK